IGTPETLVPRHWSPYGRPGYDGLLFRRQRRSRRPLSVGVAREALVGTCQTTTYGSPCDPDDTGPLTECQGVCAPDPNSSSGKMACLLLSTVGLSNVDGRLCGNDEACSAVCSGTQCVSQQAANGTPCRPSNVHDKCAGACDNGTC